MTPITEVDATAPGSWMRQGVVRGRGRASLGGEAEISGNRSGACGPAWTLKVPCRAHSDNKSRLVELRGIEPLNLLDLRMTRTS